MLPAAETDPVNPDMPPVLMLLSNDFAPDPRVHKEARTLQRAGYPVSIYCLARTPKKRPLQERIDGIQVVRFEVGPVRTGSVWQVFRQVGRFSTRVVHKVMTEGLRFAVLHAHDLDTLALGTTLRRHLRVPLVYDTHEFFPGYTPNRWLNRLLYLLESWHLRRVDAVIHASPVRRDLFRRAHPRSHPPYHEVLENFPEKQADFVKTPHPRLVFQYQGVLNPGRCVQEMVQAVGLLTPSERARMQVEIYGTINAYAEAVQRSVIQQGLTETVTLQGFVPPAELARATRGTDVGLVALRPTHPNSRYSASNKLYDAMAAKNAVLAQDTPGVREVVEGGGLGWVCDFRDPADVARAMRAVLSTPDLSARQEAAFRAHESRYHWEAQESRLVDLYRTLAG